MDREPTPEIIAQTLNRAENLMREHESFDLMRALAEATTSAQCAGIQGFKVFAALRTTIGEALPGKDHPYVKVANFSSAAQRAEVLDVLKAVTA